MKKIIYTLLVAVLAFSFMGCPSVYEDLKFEEKVPTPAYIQGAMTPADTAVAMEVNGDVATYTFKYSAKDHSGWESEPGTVNFKVCPEIAGGRLNWPLAWSNAKLTVNGEAVEVTEQNTGNISCSGLLDGEEYTIKVTAGAKSVKIEVTGKKGEIVLPTPYYLDGLYLVGCGCAGDHFEFNTDKLLWNPTLTKATGELVYTTEFIYNNSMPHGGWDHTNDGNVAIKLSTMDWKTSWGKTTIEAGKDYVELEKSGDNSFVKGLTDGTKYKLYVKTTPDGKVFAKVVSLYSKTITVNVTGLPDSANGAVMYLTGDYFGNWAEPGDGNASIKGTVADGTVSFSFPYYTEGKPEFELTIEGKAASAGWARPEIAGSDGGNAKFTVNQDKTVVTVTYVETTQHKDGGDVYCCKWEVK